MLEAEFWVFLAFVAFLGVLGYFGMHNKLLQGIDNRRDRIRTELDEARRLKDEAQALLARYEQRQHEVERLAAEAAAKVEEFVTRHTRMAQDKIAQAEAQALADVRSAAADAAVAAASSVLAATVKDGIADNLLAQGVADLKTKLR